MAIAMKEEAIFLAFDFGLKRIGVAVGQTITGTATPLPLLEAKNGELDWQEVDKLVTAWKPDGFVVGIPYNMDNTVGTVTDLAKRFAKDLAARFALPVYQADERLTTVEAKQNVFNKKGYRGLKNESIDSVAAKLIFEGWVGSIAN